MAFFDLSFPRDVAAGVSVVPSGACVSPRSARLLRNATRDGGIPAAPGRPVSGSGPPTISPRSWHCSRKWAGHSIPSSSATGPTSRAASRLTRLISCSTPATGRGRVSAAQAIREVLGVLARDYRAGPRNGNRRAWRRHDRRGLGGRQPDRARHLRRRAGRRRRVSAPASNSTSPRASRPTRSRSTWPISWATAGSAPSPRFP